MRFFDWACVYLCAYWRRFMILLILLIINKWVLVILHCLNRYPLYLASGTRHCVLLYIWPGLIQISQRVYLVTATKAARDTSYFWLAWAHLKNVLIGRPRKAIWVKAVSFIFTRIVLSIFLSRPRNYGNLQLSNHRHKVVYSIILQKVCIINIANIGQNKAF